MVTIVGDRKVLRICIKPIGKDEEEMEDKIWFTDVFEDVS